MKTEEISPGPTEEDITTDEGSIERAWRKRQQCLAPSTIDAACTSDPPRDTPMALLLSLPFTNMEQVRIGVSIC